MKCIPSEYAKEIINDIDPLLHFYAEKKNTKYYTVIVNTLKNLREMKGCQQYIEQIVREFKESYAKRKKFVRILEEI